MYSPVIGSSNAIVAGNGSGGSTSAWGSVVGSHSAHSSSSTSTVTAPAAAPVAPLIEPPAEFGHVMPGIYRCSASALTEGLPSAPKGWKPDLYSQRVQGEQRSTPNAAQRPGLQESRTVAMTGAQPLSYSASSSSHHANGHAAAKTGPASGGIHSLQAGVLHSSFPISQSGHPASLNSNVTANSTQQKQQQQHNAMSTWAANALPTEVFLSSLQLRTILFLAPEKKPTALAAWCDAHRIRLIHLGLGALADDGPIYEDGLPGGRGGSGQSGQSGDSGSLRDAVRQHLAATDGITRARGASLVSGAKIMNDIHGSNPVDPGEVDHHRIRVSQTWWEPHGAARANPSDRMSLERLAKESLELLLDRQNLPCLICDMTGVNETGIVVGCLRRLQRFNFASIRLEYRTWAANRARASHERFVEMFDTDLVCIPTKDQLPEWFALQMTADEAEEEELMRS